GWIAWANLQEIQPAECGLTRVARKPTGRELTNERTLRLTTRLCNRKLLAGSKKRRTIVLKQKPARGNRAGFFLSTNHVNYGLIVMRGGVSPGVGRLVAAPTLTTTGRSPRSIVDVRVKYTKSKPGCSELVILPGTKLVVPTTTLAA